MKSLTQNAIKDISENITTTHPIYVQIHSFDSELLIKNENCFFKAKLSDGSNYQDVVLKNPPYQLQTLLLHRQVHPIIKVKKWSSDGLPVIIITELEIVDLYQKDSIGNPLPYDEYKRNLLSQFFQQTYQNPNRNNEICQNEKNKKKLIKIMNKQDQIINKQHLQQHSYIQNNENRIQINQPQIEFIKVEQVQHLDLGKYCSLLVIVRDVKKIKYYTDKQGQIQQRRTYQIYDQTGQINVTFWGENVEKYEFKAGQIIALSKLKVVVYQNVKQLHGTYNTELIETSAKGLLKLKGYAELVNAFSIQKNQQGLIQNKYKLRNLKDIQEEVQKNIRTVNYKLYSVVTCQNVENQGANLIPFCRRCNKICYRVDNNKFICHSLSCQLIEIRPVWKFTLKVKLIDRTGSLCGTFREDCGYQLLNVKAQQYIEYNDEIKQQVLQESLDQFNIYLLATSIKKQGGLLEIIHKVKEIKKFSNASRCLI